MAAQDLVVLAQVVQQLVLHNLGFALNPIRATQPALPHALAMSAIQPVPIQATISATQPIVPRRCLVSVPILQTSTIAQTSALLIVLAQPPYLVSEPTTVTGLAMEQLTDQLSAIALPIAR